MFRLRGKGITSFRGGAPGDLDAKIVFEVPVNLDRRQREALENAGNLLGRSNFPEAARLAEKTRIFFEHKKKLGK